MNSNPYFRWAASWIGFIVGLFAWSLIVGLVGIYPLYAWVYATGSILLMIAVVLLMIVGVIIAS